MRPLPIANPRNPWQREQLEYLEEPPDAGLQVYEENAKSILAENDSPDLGFRWSLNPYRGCMHACAYCYARPSHEYLGFGAGTDFDRKIVIKPNAALLLREAFDKASWRGELIAFSGATDCYQPLEATYGLTRACLEVCRDYRNPVGIVTKSPLIERDLALLVEMARHSSVQVSVSIPFFDEDKARAVEPYVATPARRLRTIARLAEAGIAVGVNVAPVIPGLSDEDIPRILKAAYEAGARTAYMGLVRLPGSVKQVFSERMRAAFPLRAEKILSRIRDTRAGELNDPRFGARGRGTGEYAEVLRRLFQAQLARLGMREGESLADDGETTFQRPTDRGGQLRLFDGVTR